MIARRRKRPRVKSCSFRTLGWLIRREAAWLIASAGEPPERLLYSRRLFVMRTTRSVEQDTRLWLHYFPERRYYP